MKLVFAAMLLAFVADAQVPEYHVQVIHAYPHDPLAFTQGLEYHSGFLYEGTGLEGSSMLRKLDLESGRVLQAVGLEEQYFGEGITLFGDRIIQLTWQTHRGFVYEASTFKMLKTFEYPGEGWGLTNDGKQIYMSDGTAEIRCWDPATLKETRRFTVHDGAKPVNMLNELEIVQGELYANIWQTDKIARISPADGRVLGWIDLKGLLTDEERAHGADVLNGIAYDPAKDRLFVTGKLWPKLFEIRVVKVTGHE